MSLNQMFMTQIFLNQNFWIQNIFIQNSILKKYLQIQKNLTQDVLVLNLFCTFFRPIFSPMLILGLFLLDPFFLPNNCWPKFQLKPKNSPFKGKGFRPQGRSLKNGQFY